MTTIIYNLKYAFYYTIEFVAFLFLFGIIFSIVEKKNSKSIYYLFGRNGLIVTGIFGTVIHEFSHMLFCVIFRHEITDFALFRPYKSQYDGIMGYVNHRHNTNSKYQRIGNFFIGIAPIIGGTFFLILSLWMLLPSEFNQIYSTFEKNMTNMENINSIVDSFNIYVNIIISIIVNLNPFSSHSIIRYLLFIFIMYSVTTHMDLSMEDLKNSKTGFALFFILLFIINLIFMYLGLGYQIMLMKVIITILSFLTVSMFFALFTMFITLVIENMV